MAYAPPSARADVTLSAPEWSLPARCGGPDGLVPRIRRLVSGGEWSSDQTVVVSVVPTRDGVSFEVRVRIGDEALMRTIPAEESCTVMLAAVSIVVAVALTEPESLAPVEEMSGEPEPPEAVPIADPAVPPTEETVATDDEAPAGEPEDEAPEESSPPPSAPPRYGLALSIEGVTDLADVAVPGASVAAYGALGRLRWDAVVGFRATRARDIVPAGDAQARFRAVTGRAGVCAPFVRPRSVVFACAGVELGVVHGAAPGTKHAAAARAVVLAGEAEIRVAVPRDAALHATFFSGVAAYPLRASFEVLNEGSVYTTPIVAATLGVRLERSWR